MNEYHPKTAEVIKNFVPRRYVEKDIINIAGQPSFQNDPDTLTKAITEPIWEILDRTKTKYFLVLWSRRKKRI